MDLHDHRNQNSPSHKNCSSIIGSLYLKIVFVVVVFFVVFFVVMWDKQSTLLSDTNQHKDLIQESLAAENYIATHYCFQNEILHVH